jgi:hypothetical protein
MDRSALPEAHQRVFEAAMSIVDRASHTRESILPAHEARRLLAANPDCGLSERDISEFLVRLAIEHGLATDTTS